MNRISHLLKGLMLLAAAGGLSAPEPALAQVADVVVIPVGEGPALGPTARAARALVQRYNKLNGEQNAMLHYPPPLLPPPDKKMQRLSKKLLTQARHHWTRMQLDKVRAMADKALDLEKKLMKAGESPERYVEALYYMAAVAQSEGKVKPAFKEMNDASLFTRTPPDKDQFSPELVQLFQRIVAERAPMGTVQLSSTPPALVWFNKDLHGPAAGALKLPAGLYLVKVYAPGHVLRQKWLRVHPHRSRDLLTVLNRDASPEPELMGKLRQELEAEAPGPMVSQLALELTTTQVVLVGAGAGCSAEACTIKVGWAKEEAWKLRRTLDLKGDGEALAEALLPDPHKPSARKGGAARGKGNAARAVAPLTVATCITDSQCGLRKSCENGRCVEHTPITRRWWFWTIVGVAAAGVAVGIAVPLANPASPVIEVR